MQSLGRSRSIGALGDSDRDLSHELSIFVMNGCNPGKLVLRKHEAQPRIVLQYFPVNQICEQSYGFQDVASDGDVTSLHRADYFQP